MIKHCPHCNASIYFKDEIESRKCWKCGQRYLVKQRLSKITLEKPYNPRNIEAEIIKYISEHGKSYTAEIAKYTKCSRESIRNKVDCLLDQGVLNAEKCGNTKWVSLKVEA